MALKPRNAYLAVKIESVPGVFEAPNPATDGMLIRTTLPPRPQVNVQNTDEATGSLDPEAPEAGGMTFMFDASVYLKGSGVAATAPEFGSLLRIAGFQESVTSAAVPVAAEASAGGADQKSLTLGATASATAHAYRGMPILLSGDIEKTAFIAAYTAAKLATLTEDVGAQPTTDTDYQIPANVRYLPASSSIPSASISFWMDGKRWDLAGCRAQWSAELTSGGTGTLTFQLNGMFVEEDDEAMPTRAVDATRPPIWKNSVSVLDYLLVGTSSFTLQSGIQLVNPDNPNQVEGYDPAEITTRNITGTLDPLTELVATKDRLTQLRSNTEMIYHARLGSVAGNRVGVTIPRYKLTDRQVQNAQGIARDNLPGSAVGPDAGAIFCFY